MFQNQAHCVMMKLPFAKTMHITDVGSVVDLLMEANL